VVRNTPGHSAGYHRVLPSSLTTSLLTTNHFPRDPAIVITGIGLITSLGPDRESTWDALKRGRTGARKLEIPGLGPGFAGFPCPRPPSTEVDPALDLLERAADQAMADAGLDGPGRDLDPDRAAVLIGLSKGGIRNLCLSHEIVRSAPANDRALARAWAGSWPSAGASAVAARHGLRGPCLAPIAACATGLVAALQAVDLIRRGACDVALAGGADASLEPILLAAFGRMKVLARVEGDPSRAVRPWDLRRSGFLIGEGGAVLVLERLDRARARGVRPYAELAGGAIGSDAHHETALDPDPAGLARVIRRALADAGMTSADLDAVNVHGTATPSNDPLECRALRLALGTDAGRLACSANKAQIGHLLGAAGSAELAIAALSIRDGFAPPTLNLDDPDPACDLDGTPLVGRHLPIRAILKLSIGFGGHLAAAILRKVDPS
jgi:3-oxoacyl-[acyl-carrier-protein] synthase II